MNVQRRIDTFARSISLAYSDAATSYSSQFLVQIDGVNSSQNDPDHNVLCIACTNLPWELDDAALR